MTEIFFILFFVCTVSEDEYTPNLVEFVTDPGTCLSS